MRRECRERFPRHLLQRKTQVSDPGMHHGTCVTHAVMHVGIADPRRWGNREIRCLYFVETVMVWRAMIWPAACAPPTSLYLQKLQIRHKVAAIHANCSKCSGVNDVVQSACMRISLWKELNFPFIDVKFYRNQIYIYDAILVDIILIQWNYLKVCMWGMAARNVRRAYLVQ